MRRTTFLLAALALLAGTGCAGVPEPDPGLRAAPGEDAPPRVVRPGEGRPTHITVATVTAGAGRTVELAFPPGNERGVAFTLEQRLGNVWETRFYLIAPSSPGGRPDWWSVEDSQGRGWEDLGVTGRGPDVVRIPGGAEPGEYRICTANARDRACGAVTVT